MPFSVVSAQTKVSGLSKLVVCATIVRYVVVIIIQFLTIGLMGSVDSSKDS